MSNIIKVFRKILRDAFEIDKTSEKAWVAITYALNVYDFYMSKDCPLPHRKVELAIGDAVEIVCVFAGHPPNGKSGYGWWKRRWHECLAKSYADKKF